VGVYIKVRWFWGKRILSAHERYSTCHRALLRSVNRMKKKKPWVWYVFTTIRYVPFQNFRLMLNSTWANKSEQESTSVFNVPIRLKQSHVLLKTKACTQTTRRAAMPT
jgi:hypothetical protein